MPLCSPAPTQGPSHPRQPTAFQLPSHRWSSLGKTAGHPQLSGLVGVRPAVAPGTARRWAADGSTFQSWESSHSTRWPGRPRSALGLSQGLAGSRCGAETSLGMQQAALFFPFLHWGLSQGICPSPYLKAALTRTARSARLRCLPSGQEVNSFSFSTLPGQPSF